MPFSSRQNQPIRTQLLDVYREAIKQGLSVQDVEDEIGDLKQLTRDAREVSKRDKRLNTRFYQVKRLTPVILVTVGSLLIANTIWPIAYYSLVIAPELQKGSLKTPISVEAVIAENTGVKEGEKTQVQYVDPTPQILKEQLDYSNLANWFTERSMQQQAAQVQNTTYVLEIPSLGVEKAEVHIGGTDLNQSLIQYPTTAMPGEFGAPVIFGHSVLRQFYRPSLSNPNRYKSIFSKIMTLKVGEEIRVSHNGQTYVYQVEEKRDVQPDDPFILEQHHKKQQLKLITCVPEGTYLRRGVVVSNLVRVEGQQ